MTDWFGRFGALVLCAGWLVVPACSEDRGALSGTGGSTGAGGATGTGGSMGSGTCDKGGTASPVGSECDPVVAQPRACNMDGVTGTADDATCWRTCGPNKSGIRTCACLAGVWRCPTCDYDISDPARFDCYKTDSAVECPPDPSDVSGAMLPASGGTCTLPICQPCGSTTKPGYRDSAGSPKVGWCVCVPTNDPSLTVYSCAPVADWAPQCR